MEKINYFFEELLQIIVYGNIEYQYHEFETMGIL